MKITASGKSLNSADVALVANGDKIDIVASFSDNGKVTLGSIASNSKGDKLLFIRYRGTKGPFVAGNKHGRILVKGL